MCSSVEGSAGVRVDVSDAEGVSLVDGVSLNTPVDDGVTQSVGGGVAVGETGRGVSVAGHGIA
jgi:hypothetical protein